jgi:hypothetical protein
MKQTHEEIKQTYKEIVSLWKSQPFLERLLFLMNKCRFNQDDAEVIAKKDFHNINDLYRIIIFNELNKN